MKGFNKSKIVLKNMRKQHRSFLVTTNMGAILTNSGIYVSKYDKYGGYSKKFGDMCL